MKTRRFFTLAFAIAFCCSATSKQVQAQQPTSTAASSGQAIGAASAKDSANLLAQVWRGKRRAFSLMSDRAEVAPLAAGPNLTVIGSGTLGRLTKWTGFTSSNSTIGDSTIFEDKNGLVGIGTDTPTSKLTVAGIIEATGGFKFPAGAHDATLKGDGTLSSPLGVAVPLNLTGASSFDILSVTNIFSGTGVRGTSHDGVGVFGNSNNGTAIAGTSTIGTGVFGSSNSGVGVEGKSSSNIGVFGGSTSGIGVIGSSSSSDGMRGTSQDGNGVRGASNSTVSTNAGVRGKCDSCTGVLGESTSGTGGFGSSMDGFGIEGKSTNNSGVSGQSVNGSGITGNSTNNSGVSASSFSSTGVSAVSFGSDGVSGLSSGVSPSVAGVRGISSATPTGAIAGRFQGKVSIENFTVTGSTQAGDLIVAGKLQVTSGLKMFHIDHPLDPENKYLNHAAIESSEVLNVYSGNVTTNADGEAVVTLPDWFEALNQDFRYQLTVVGQFAQAIVARKIKGNRFAIKTNAPDVEVSWQVTGVRSDPTARKYKFDIEEEKSKDERGYYLNPDAFGQSEEKSIQWARDPEGFKLLKQRQMEAEQRRGKQKNQ